MSAKPDDRWAMELLDEVVPVLNKRTDEATERIRLFEEYLRRVGLAIPVETMIPSKTTTAYLIFKKLDYDGEWRVRCDGGSVAPYAGTPLLECPRWIKLMAMVGWDVFVATVVEKANAWAKGQAS